MVSFKCSKPDFRLAEDITERALYLSARLGNPDPPGWQDMLMDIIAAHTNGCPLRLAELLAADDANFGHDVFGIRRYMDRKTGRLTNCFVPRFAMRATLPHVDEAQAISK